MKKSFSKKSLAFLLAIAVVLTSLATSFAVTASANETELDIWDGTIADAYAGGTGTQADPYLISTPEQLARMIGYDVLTNYSGNVANGSVDKYYKLTTDIYLNDVSKAKWYEGSGINHWFNAGSSRFCGYFDGAGYTVYGLAFADTTAMPAAMDDKTTVIAMITAIALFERLRIKFIAFSPFKFLGLCPYLTHYKNNTLVP